ncbi:MAG: hypothetical protein Q7V43_19410 [Myxococcales bacterium]|nr:hypothetical protein [Myxococcales bacterium]
MSAALDGAASTGLRSPDVSHVPTDSALSPRQSQRFWDGVRFAERFFMGTDEVHGAMRRLCQTLEADGIPYAIAGAMALNLWGYRRVTTDVAVLLDAAGLAAFKAKHLGRGYLERFPGSKGVRDTESGVKIDVLLTGDFPGDGLPKEVSFPSPTVAVRGDAVMVLPIRYLVELKLASGLTNPDRLKDLADVQELIRHAALPLELVDDHRPDGAGEVRRDLEQHEA